MQTQASLEAWMPEGQSVSCLITTTNPNVCERHTDLTNLSFECIDDELQVFGVHTLDTFLHHMVAVLIFDTLQHMPVKLLHNLNLQQEIIMDCESSHWNQ